MNNTVISFDSKFEGIEGYFKNLNRRSKVFAHWLFNKEISKFNPELLSILTNEVTPEQSKILESREERKEREAIEDKRNKSVENMVLQMSHKEIRVLGNIIDNQYDIPNISNLVQEQRDVFFEKCRKIFPQGFDINPYAYYAYYEKIDQKKPVGSILRNGTIQDMSDVEFSILRDIMDGEKNLSNLEQLGSLKEQEKFRLKCQNIFYPNVSLKAGSYISYSERKLSNYNNNNFGDEGNGYFV